MILAYFLFYVIGSFFSLSVVNINLSYNFGTAKDRDFIFVIYTSLKVPKRTWQCINAYVVSALR